MKLSIYIPRGVIANSFIKDMFGELMYGFMEDPEATKDCLIELVKVLKQERDGVVIFTDGRETTALPYDGAEEFYHCGDHYADLTDDGATLYKPVDYDEHLLVVIDESEATIGRSTVSTIKVLWNRETWVPSKHVCTSCSITEVERDSMIDEWVAAVAAKLAVIHRMEDIIIGGPGSVKDKLLYTLYDREFKDVLDIRPTSYSSENGLFELLSRSRYEDGIEWALVD